MLTMPLAQRLQLPLSILVTWLSTIQPAFEAARICKDPDFELKDQLAINLEREEALTSEAKL